MRIFLTSSQRSFYAQHKQIEMEGIFSKEESFDLQQTAEHLLTKRLQPKTDAAGCLSIELFRMGREIWQEDAQLRRKVITAKLLQVASQLFQLDALRLGWIQYLRPGMLDKLGCLKELCSFSEIIGGAIVSLDPSTEGNVFFCTPELPLTLDLQTQRALLIVFVPQKTLYCLQPKDPLTHLLKRSGYAFGDQLQDHSHPLIYS